MHDYRYSSDPVDVQTIIRYQAEQRAAWHEAITNVDGTWDIGIINKEVMRETREKVFYVHRVKADVAQKAKVSFILIPLCLSYALPSCSGHHVPSASQRTLRHHIQQKKNKK
jgi:hypothetical protein